EPSGFGLGLALAKRATHWHGGELSITRSPLGGARLTLTLALRPA
ncbi:ATP-binding protein, partial [Pseudomonas sp. K5002]|nr:two-component sensor histidine kinase [Pseudomonas sp. K5002]